MLNSKNIAEIIQLLEDAGKQILQIYHSNNFNTTLKTDKSPVTAADIASDTIIKNGLLKINPGINVFSEETKDIDFNLRGSWNPLWILDPLDGTKEFIGLNGEFCICLALISGSKPVAGFIHAPVSDESWFAIAGKGAYKIIDGKKIKLPLKIPAGPTVITISRSHFNEAEAKWINDFSEKNNSIVSTQGSAIKFCRIAEGSADIYPKFGPINEWDVAAGDIIVSESGGRMLEMLSGLPPVYNKKDSAQPHFIVSGKRVTGDQVLINPQGQ